MKAHIMLADLVLLQMEGYLEKAMELLNAKNEILPVIEEAKSKSTNPLLYRSIVNKSILNQFGDKHITLRELGQNAKDAYLSDEKERKVEFTTSENEEGFLISVRDYGRGMSPESLIKDLLIPYNSSKYLDADTIGEHGIGWYSVMDLAYKVEVITSKGGKLSKALVYKSGDDWYADIEVGAGDQKGTVVNAYVEKNKTNKSLIFQNLVKHLGYVDSQKTLITHDNEKINTMDDEYPYSVSVVLNYKGRKDSLRMLYRKGDEKKKTILLTQDGLFIGNVENPFHKKTLYYDFLNMCLEASLDIWIDLPKNIGLTKGRKEVVKKDQTIYFTALRRSFEVLLLSKILPDEELMRRMDNELAYVAKNIFFDSYDLASAMYFRNNQPFDFDTMAFEESEESLSALSGFAFKNDDKENTFIKRAKKYFNEVTHLCYDFFSLRFIPAIKVLNGSSSFIKISANDMIKLDYNSLLSEGSLDSPPDREGVYYSRESKFCYAVSHQIYIVKVTEQGKDSAPVKTRSEIQDEVEVKPLSFSVFREKLKTAGRAGDYIAFFEGLQLLDRLLFEAGGKGRSEFFFLINRKEDIICPTDKGLGINFYHKILQDITSEIHSKSFERSLFLKTLDLYIYAKTYAVSKKFYISSEEVEDFYEHTKKEIRDCLINYIFDNKIDIERELKKIFTDYSSNQLLSIGEISEVLKA